MIMLENKDTWVQCYCFGQNIHFRGVFWLCHQIQLVLFVPSLFSKAPKNPTKPGFKSKTKFKKIICTQQNFFKESALGRFSHRVAMSGCRFICLFVPFHVLDLEAYFAPTSQSRMSKMFRDSESLGKSAGKKWSQNWTFLLEVV